MICKWNEPLPAFTSLVSLVIFNIQQRDYHEKNNSIISLPWCNTKLFFSTHSTRFPNPSDTRSLSVSLCYRSLSLSLSIPMLSLSLSRSLCSRSPYALVLALSLSLSLPLHALIFPLSSSIYFLFRTVILSLCPLYLQPNGKIQILYNVLILVHILYMSICILTFFSEVIRALTNKLLVRWTLEFSLFFNPGHYTYTLKEIQQKSVSINGNLDMWDGF